MKSLSEMIEGVGYRRMMRRQAGLPIEESEISKLNAVATILARAVEYNCRVESQIDAAFENYKNVSADAIKKAKEILGD